MGNNTTTDYQQQAIDFMNRVGLTMDVKYLKTGKYFDDDKEERDIYVITITKSGRSYEFNFGQSVNNSGKYILLDARLISQIGRKFAHEGEIKKLRINHFDLQASTRLNKSFSEPTAYDILACLTKYEVGTFEDFCNEFGYDTDSRKAEKTYKAVKKEYLNVCRLFSEDELLEMQEIQ